MILSRITVNVRRSFVGLLKNKRDALKIHSDNPAVRGPIVLFQSERCFNALQETWMFVSQRYHLYLTSLQPLLVKMYLSGSAACSKPEIIRHCGLTTIGYEYCLTGTAHLAHFQRKRVRADITSLSLLMSLCETRKQLNNYAAVIMESVCKYRCIFF